MALMDSEGRSKALKICGQIDTVTLDTDLPNKILEEGNLVLDETGMLATKTREGLKEISEAVTALINKKTELKNEVIAEGNRLRNNYDAYLARLEEQKKLKEQMAENGDQVGGSANGSSSVTSKPSLRNDKFENALR